MKNLQLKTTDCLISIKRNLWVFTIQNPELADDIRIKELFLKIDEKLRDAHNEILAFKERCKNETI